jgi:hypothetical protein
LVRLLAAAAMKKPRTNLYSVLPTRAAQEDSSATRPTMRLQAQVPAHLSLADLVAILRTRIPDPLCSGARRLRTSLPAVSSEEVKLQQELPNHLSHSQVRQQETRRNQGGYLVVEELLLPVQALPLAEPQRRPLQVSRSATLVCTHARLRKLQTAHEKLTERNRSSVVRSNTRAKQDVFSTIHYTRRSSTRKQSLWRTIGANPWRCKLRRLSFWGREASCDIHAFF